MTPVFTIGYQQAVQAPLIGLLKQNDIDVLADVRAIARSRKPGFAKSNLAASLEEAGIAYRHFPHLGTPAEGRAAARRADMETLRLVYSGQMELPQAMMQLAQLQDLASHHRICLLCYCRDAKACHRSLLVDAAFDGREVIHLVPQLV